MATVVDDVTGEVVTVTPVEAAAVIVLSSTMGDSDMPDDAAQRIEQAMVAAITNAQSAGISDPAKIRDLMLMARDSAKIAMHTEMRDLRSQLG